MLVTSIFFFSLNSFPNKPWFLRVSRTSLLKTLLEKEKLLVTSNFSFFHSVFYPVEKISGIFLKFNIVVCKPFEFGRVQNLLFGNGLMFSIAVFLKVVESWNSVVKCKGSNITSDWLNSLVYPIKCFVSFKFVCKLYQCRRV